MGGLQYSLLPLACHFILFTGFSTAKVLIMMKSIYRFLKCGLGSWCHIKKPFNIQTVVPENLLLPVESFIMLHFPNKSVLHSEFIFVTSMKFRLRFIFMLTDMGVVFLATHRVIQNMVLWYCTVDPWTIWVWTAWVHLSIFLRFSYYREAIVSITLDQRSPTCDSWILVVSEVRKVGHIKQSYFCCFIISAWLLHM